MLTCVRTQSHCDHYNRTDIDTDMTDGRIEYVLKTKEHLFRNVKCAFRLFGRENFVCEFSATWAANLNALQTRKPSEIKKFSTRN